MSIRKLRNYDWPNLYIFEVPNVLNGYDYNNAKRRESLSSEEFPDDTRRYSYDDYSNQSSRDSFEATGNKEKRPSFFNKSVFLVFFGQKRLFGRKVPK